MKIPIELVDIQTPNESLNSLKTIKLLYVSV